MEREKDAKRMYKKNALTNLEPNGKEEEEEEEVGEKVYRRIGTNR